MTIKTILGLLMVFTIGLSVPNAFAQQPDNTGNLTAIIDDIQDTLDWIIDQLDPAIEGSIGATVADNTIAISQLWTWNEDQDDRLDTVESGVEEFDTEMVSLSLRMDDVETDIQEEIRVREYADSFIREDIVELARPQQVLVAETVVGHTTLTVSCPNDKPFIVDVVDVKRRGISTSIQNSWDAVSDVGGIHSINYDNQPNLMVLHGFEFKIGDRWFPGHTTVLYTCSSAK